MKASESFEITDRYKAAGVPYPDPKTMCEGQCEGMGFYPQFLEGPWLVKGSARLETITVPVVEAKDLPEVLDNPAKTLGEAASTAIAFECPEPTDEEVRLWHAEHTRSNHEQCDGWHFIKCGDCSGTGKRPLREAV